MLAEHFVAAISTPNKTNDTSIPKDAGIFFHQSQPLPGQKAVFKKSAAAPHCVAVSEAHIFAAQLDKAVIHVYNREKGNQEALIPFQERIHAVALAANDTVLVLGTESGRVLLWETCTGRLVSAPTSHLQQVTSIAVDPSSNFILTGSGDSNINVWSLPNLLAFSSSNESRSSIHTLSTHRGAITALACGHSHSFANIAISASQDKSAIIWDYHKGIILRTYLLGDAPLALALDPADRAFYTTYEDGSVQMVDFYDESQQSTPVNTLHTSSSSSISVIEPPKSSRWHATSQNLGKGYSLSLSWDGASLFSGHESGKVARWDIARGLWQSTAATLPGPVTNLQFLPPTGFPNEEEPRLKVPSIVKPRQEYFKQDEGGVIPGNYSLSVQINRPLARPNLHTPEATSRSSTFATALTHPSLPEDLLSESLNELSSWNPTSKGGQAGSVEQAADFVSFAEESANANGSQDSSAEQIKNLQSQLEALQRIQKVTFKQLAQLRKERDWWVEKEEKRQKKRGTSAFESTKSKAHDEDMDVDMSEGDEEASHSEDGANEEDAVEYISTDEEERIRRKSARKGKVKAKTGKSAASENGPKQAAVAIRKVSQKKVEEEIVVGGRDGSRES